MLHIITSAPAFVVRDALAWVPGSTIGDAADIDAPAWAETLIVAPQSDLLAMALSRLSAFRFDRFVPRPAISDPTYAQAAFAIERGGSSSAPAAAFAR